MKTTRSKIIVPITTGMSITLSFHHKGKIQSVMNTYNIKEWAKLTPDCVVDNLTKSMINKKWKP